MLDFTTLPRRFSLLCQPLVGLLDQAVESHNADYRTHKFSAKNHVLLTIFAQLVKAESSHALIEELNDLDSAHLERNLRQLIGFDKTDYWGQPLSLAQSSLSRANAQRSWRLWRYLFHRLLGMVRPHLNHHQLEGLDKLGEVVALDGSLFDCLPRMCWALYSSTKNKLKAHFFYNLDGLPDKLVLTTGKGSERSVLEQHLWPQVTYLVDRGYTDYDLFATLMHAQAHFVTRLRAKADFKLKTTHPVEVEAVTLGVVADQTIELKAKQAGAIEVRLVTYHEPLSGKCYRYLTSRFDLDSLTIVRLYLYRWEVELFIKWIKAHLRFDHWYSENENGVLIQLYAGLITFLLVKYFVALVAKPRYRVMNLETLRWLRLHLFEKAQAVEMVAYHRLPGASDTSPPVHK